MTAVVFVVDHWLPFADDTGDDDCRGSYLSALREEGYGSTYPPSTTEDLIKHANVHPSLILSPGLVAMCHIVTSTPQRRPPGGARPARARGGPDRGFLLLPLSATPRDPHPPARRADRRHARRLPPPASRVTKGEGVGHRGSFERGAGRPLETLLRRRPLGTFVFLSRAPLSAAGRGNLPVLRQRPRGTTKRSGPLSQLENRVWGGPVYRCQRRQPARGCQPKPAPDVRRQPVSGGRVPAAEGCAAAVQPHDARVCTAGVPSPRDGPQAGTRSGRLFGQTTRLCRVNHLLFVRRCSLVWTFHYKLQCADIYNRHKQPKPDCVFLPVCHYRRPIHI